MKGRHIGIKIELTEQLSRQFATPAGAERPRRDARAAQSVARSCAIAGGCVQRKFDSRMLC
jgi:hypothetical protein